MLNLTLLLEMAHFFCAYLIVTRIIMKPAVALILEKDQKKEMLVRDARVLADALSQRRSDLAQESFQVYQALHEQQPQTDDASYKVVSVEDTVPGASEEITVNHQKLQQALIDRILYDR